MRDLISNEYIYEDKVAQWVYTINFKSSIFSFVAKYEHKYSKRELSYINGS